jgi:hypothetical protein
MPTKKKPNNSTNENEENSSTHPTILPLSLPTGGGTPTLADRKAQLFAEMDALESFNSIAMVPTRGLKSDAEVHAQVVAPSTTGLAIAGSMYSLSGGVCHSLGDQSLGTLGDEIDPFFQLDVDSLTIMAIKEELDRLEIEYTSAKKDELKVQLKAAYPTEHHSKATSYFRKYKGGYHETQFFVSLFSVCDTLFCVHIS